MTQTENLLQSFQQQQYQQFKVSESFSISWVQVFINQNLSAPIIIAAISLLRSHLRMSFDPVRDILEINVLLLQNIHTVQHQISLHRCKLYVYQRERWSLDEEQLLQNLLAQFGKEDLKRISQIMISKTQRQVYHKVYSRASQSIIQ
ncbi:SANT/Myb_domain [Hexamita inflata]|uniref:SANT/Myb domain n=1 Tax=Hexamita inflata TaxID=28002 RepID=A0AA86QG51_9EUKA|nr:SANT/Myb domain [Hexamita inflata]CAI9958681.1 SANT/Myb domain [Hexamita inflata]